MTEDIKQLAAKLAQARLNQAEAKEKMKQLLAAFQATPKFIQAEKSVQDADHLLFETESILRQAALVEYQTTLNKQGEGYEIKILKTVTISDEKMALEWCKTNFTPALSINSKVFLAAAKAGAIPEKFIFSSASPKVYIDSDLSRFIKSE